MKVIVDTNVPIVANGNSPQATPACVSACAVQLGEILEHHTLVLDSLWKIIGEYQNNLNPTGQPGVGDRFFKWVLNNWTNKERCELVTITSVLGSNNGNDFAEFPNDPALAGFDPSDRKFVAVTLAHPDRPPILNAVDTDWAIYEHDLAKHGIVVEFICPDDIQKIMIDK